MSSSRREFLLSSASVASGLWLSPSRSFAQASPSSVKVDCHTHFYDPSRPQGVPWPGKQDSVLYRTVLPTHFLKEAEPVGVTKTVVVEASPWVEDNAWLLELAAKNSSIVGVVGNLTLGQAEFADQLRRFAKNPLYRGIRVNHALVRRGLDQPEFLADVRRLADAGIELDINGGPDMPADAARLAEKIPELRIVINHLGNVDIDGGPPPEGWLSGMKSAAKHKNVFCKVSALVEHARPKTLTAKEPAVPRDLDFYRPVLDAIWRTFGDDRLIYGSNWPVSERFASYQTLFTIVDQYVRSRGPAAVEKFFVKNAQAAYQWPT